MGGERDEKKESVREPRERCRELFCVCGRGPIDK